MKKSLKRKHGETFSELHPRKTTGMAQTTIGFRPADDFSNGRACFANPRREGRSSLGQSLAGWVR